MCARQDEFLFLSGSLDGKLRIWSIEKRRVVMSNEVVGGGECGEARQQVIDNACARARRQRVNSRRMSWGNGGRQLRSKTTTRGDTEYMF